VNQNDEVQELRHRSGSEVEQLIIKFEASGAGASDFCREHKLARSVLYRHLQRRRVGKVKPKPCQGLVAVSLIEEPGHVETGDQCALEVVVRGGRRIQVWPDFDSGTLERLLSILEKA
jgi:hypothetical protein